MIFLLDYDRSAGRLISLRDFEDDARPIAQAARLELELELHRSGIEREIVLLQAPSLDALKRTHRRYFEDLRQIARSTST
jgi:hypothetical protein